MIFDRRLPVGPGVSSLLQLSFETEGMKTLTEVTLAVLLFADASTLDLRQLRHDKALTARLLGIGMPLTMLLGTAVFFGLLPGEGIAFAALLGIILAPTDAALGLPIFNDPKVPVRIRRLNVGSLNGGIPTPFVLLFLSLAATSQLYHSGWLVTALLEIMFAAVGALGGLGRMVTVEAADRGWSSGICSGLPSSVAGASSSVIDGNGLSYFPAESSSAAETVSPSGLPKMPAHTRCWCGLSSAVLAFRRRCFMPATGGRLPVPF
jgi:NhaP-type Na+/H+ or K+/H+ antiporter